MIILITGASHTGKTVLAQKLLEKYKYPYLSMDHLKMGLIRSGHTTLTPMSEDAALTAYLWPIVREMIKTAIENGQNLIVEGCYIPFDWAKDFDKEYLECIKYYCLIMSTDYIKKHFADIKKYANAIEQRLDDTDCTMESVLEDNARMLELAIAHKVEYVLIGEKYEIEKEDKKMTINEYQKLAMTTLNPNLDKKDILINGVMGLCGESGEAIDIVKKHLAQGHELDRDGLIKEIGDVAWYIAEIATVLDIELEEVLARNIEKLKKRYPEGFSTERSVGRQE